MGGAWSTEGRVAQSLILAKKKEKEKDRKRAGARSAALEGTDHPQRSQRDRGRVGPDRPSVALCLLVPILAQGVVAFSVAAAQQLGSVVSDVAQAS